MNIVDVYALILEVVHLILISRHLLSWGKRLLEQLHRLSDKHLRLPHVISRRWWIGPWTRLVILRQTIMTAITLFTVFYDATDASSIVRHAGVVSLVNMTPAYLAPHLSYGADLFGLSLPTFTSLHAEIGASVVLPMAIHVAAAVKSSSTPVWAGTENKYGVVVCHPPYVQNLCLRHTDSVHRQRRRWLFSSSFVSW